MGREVVVERGGVFRIVFARAEMGLLSAATAASFAFWVDLALGDEGVGPEMMGAGRSRPSVALRESWRAKSEACHHSRNFRAKIEVGRRRLREVRRRGYTACVNVRGLKMEFAWPGRAGSDLEGCSCGAAAMARWSASPRRRMRVPISQKKGEENFELSKR